MGLAFWIPTEPGHVGSTVATAVYVVFFIATTVLAWTLRDAEGDDAPVDETACEKALPGRSCFRKEAVLRVTTGSIIFYLIQLVCVLTARVIGACQHQALSRAVTLAHGGARCSHLPVVLLCLGCV